MSLHTEIKQFLAAVKDPASLTTTRDNLAWALGLLARVDAELSGVKESLTTEPKPEDRL